MDPKVSMMLEKMKIVAGKTGVAATKAAQAAGDMAQATKLNLQIFDISTECEVLYKKIGKLVYDIHIGIEVEQDTMDEHLEQIDQLQIKLEELRQQLSTMRQQVTCTNCGKVCHKDDVYCPGCGGLL